MTVEKIEKSSKPEAIRQDPAYDFLRTQVDRLEKGQTLERPGENQSRSAHWSDDLWQCVSQTWQCVSKQFQAVSDAFLSKQEMIAENGNKETIIIDINNDKSIKKLTELDRDEEKKVIRKKIINATKEFIQEYKEMSDIYYDLYHAINLSHASKRMLKEDRTTNEHLHHIQEHLDQSLRQIGKLLKDEHFPKEDFKEIVDRKMTILREKAAFVGGVGRCLSSDYAALGDYVITYAKEAEVFATVLKDENNQNLDQLRGNLEQSFREICQRLMKAARDEYDQACCYSETQEEEAIKDKEDRELFTRFKKHYLEPFGNFLESIEQSMKEHPDAENVWRKYQALKPAHDAFCSQFAALKQRLEARLHLQKHIAAIKEKQNIACLYSDKLQEEYAKHSSPKYLKPSHQKTLNKDSIEKFQRKYNKYCIDAQFKNYIEYHVNKSKNHINENKSIKDMLESYDNIQTCDAKLNEKLKKLEEAYFRLRFTAFYQTKPGSLTVENSMKIFYEKHTQHFSTFLAGASARDAEAFEKEMEHTILHPIRSEVETQTYNQLDEICGIVKRAQKLLSDFEGIQRAVEKDHPPSLDTVASSFQSIASLRTNIQAFRKQVIHGGGKKPRDVQSCFKNTSQEMTTLISQLRRCIDTSSRDASDYMARYNKYIGYKKNKDDFIERIDPEHFLLDKKIDQLKRRVQQQELQAKVTWYSQDNVECVGQWPWEGDQSKFRDCFEEFDYQIPGVTKYFEDKQVNSEDLWNKSWQMRKSYMNIYNTFIKVAKEKIEGINQDFAELEKSTAWKEKSTTYAHFQQMAQEFQSAISKAEELYQKHRSGLDLETLAERRRAALRKSQAFKIAAEKLEAIRAFTSKPAGEQKQEIREYLAAHQDDLCWLKSLQTFSDLQRGLEDFVNRGEKSDNQDVIVYKDISSSIGAYEQRDEHREKRQEIKRLQEKNEAFDRCVQAFVTRVKESSIQPTPEDLEAIRNEITKALEDEANKLKRLYISSTDDKTCYSYTIRKIQKLEKEESGKIKGLEISGVSKQLRKSSYWHTINHAFQEAYEKASPTVEALLGLNKPESRVVADDLFSQYHTIAECYGALESTYRPWIVYIDARSNLDCATEAIRGFLTRVSGYGLSSEEQKELQSHLKTAEDLFQKIEASPEHLVKVYNELIEASKAFNRSTLQWAKEAQESYHERVNDIQQEIEMFKISLDSEKHLEESLKKLQWNFKETLQDFKNCLESFQKKSDDFEKDLEDFKSTDADDHPLYTLYLKLSPLLYNSKKSHKAYLDIEKLNAKIKIKAVKQYIKDCGEQKEHGSEEMTNGQGIEMSYQAMKASLEKLQKKVDSLAQQDQESSQNINNELRSWNKELSDTFHQFRFQDTVQAITKSLQAATDYGYFEEEQQKLRQAIDKVNDLDNKEPFQNKLQELIKTYQDIFLEKIQVVYGIAHFIEKFNNRSSNSLEQIKNTRIYSKIDEYLRSQKETIVRIDHVIQKRYDFWKEGKFSEFQASVFSKMLKSTPILQREIKQFLAKHEEDKAWLSALMPYTALNSSFASFELSLKTAQEQFNKQESPEAVWKCFKDLASKGTTLSNQFDDVQESIKLQAKDKEFGLHVEHFVRESKGALDQSTQEGLKKKLRGEYTIAYARDQFGSLYQKEPASSVIKESMRIFCKNYASKFSTYLDPQNKEQKIFKEEIKKAILDDKTIENDVIKEIKEIYNIFDQTHKFHEWLSYCNNNFLKSNKDLTHKEAKLISEHIEKLQEKLPDLQKRFGEDTFLSEKNQRKMNDLISFLEEINKLRYQKEKERFDYMKGKTSVCKDLYGKMERNNYSKEMSELYEKRSELNDTVKQLKTQLQKKKLEANLALYDRELKSISRYVKTASLSNDHYSRFSNQIDEIHTYFATNSQANIDDLSEKSQQLYTSYKNVLADMCIPAARKLIQEMQQRIKQLPRDPTFRQSTIYQRFEQSHTKFKNQIEESDQYFNSKTHSDENPSTIEDLQLQQMWLHIREQDFEQDLDNVQKAAEFVMQPIENVQKDLTEQENDLCWLQAFKMCNTDFRENRNQFLDFCNQSPVGHGWDKSEFKQRQIRIALFEPLNKIQEITKLKEKDGQFRQYVQKFKELPDHQPSPEELKQIRSQYLVAYFRSQFTSLLRERNLPELEEDLSSVKKASDIDEQWNDKRNSLIYAIEQKWGIEIAKAFADTKGITAREKSNIMPVEDTTGMFEKRYVYSRSCDPKDKNLVRIEVWVRDRMKIEDPYGGLSKRADPLYEYSMNLKTGKITCFRKFRSWDQNLPYKDTHDLSSSEMLGHCIESVEAFAKKRRIEIPDGLSITEYEVEHILNIETNGTYDLYKNPYIEVMHIAKGYDGYFSFIGTPMYTDMLFLAEQHSQLIGGKKEAKIITINNQTPEMNMNFYLD